MFSCICSDSIQRTVLQFSAISGTNSQGFLPEDLEFHGGGVYRDRLWKQLELLLRKDCLLSCLFGPLSLLSALVFGLPLYEVSFSQVCPRSQSLTWKPVCFAISHKKHQVSSSSQARVSFSECSSSAGWFNLGCWKRSCSLTGASRASSSQFCSWAPWNFQLNRLRTALLFSPRLELRSSLAKTPCKLLSFGINLAFPSESCPTNRLIF